MRGRHRRNPPLTIPALHHGVIAAQTNVLRRADPVERSLVVEVAESREGLADQLRPFDEQEPWWRVLGNPLVRVSPLSEGVPLSQGLRLQFRADDDAPRIIALTSTGFGLSAAVA